MNRILLLEDNPKVVHRVRASLPEGWTLAHAARLSEGAGILHREGARLILLDLSLPDGKGPDLVSILSAVAPEVPILALVDVGDLPSVVDLVQRGAEDYLLKTQITKEALAERLERWAPPGGGRTEWERRLASADTPTLPPLPRPQDREARFARDERVGGYVIERHLGDGGMGSVYLAHQLSLGRKVAVKFLAERFTHDPSFVKRFDREAGVLATLSHPNVVTIFDKGRHGNRYYFVMEYVDGVSLREVLSKARFGAEQALRTGMVLCEALDYAHERGVVHRDIKPENLIFTRTGQLKVTDFGLARITLGQHADGAPVTPTGTLLGTQDYMAPEARHSGRQVDQLSDVYAMGVILYEMLTGELPVGSFDPPSQKSDVDERADAVVLKALAADPARRYAKAQEMGRDIAQLIRHHGPSQSGFVPLRFEGRRHDRRTPAFPGREAFAEGIRIAP